MRTSTMNTCDRTDGQQKIEGFVADKGDFAGKEPATEEAKKAALTGVDIAIIPAGVPRMYRPHCS